MIAFLRKDLTRSTSIHHSNSVFKSSPAYFSIYLNNLCTSSDIIGRISNILVREHNFDRKFASRVAPNLSRLKKPENACSVLSFMKESGFPDYRSERIVKCNPRLLSAGLEDGIKPKIVFFRGIGLFSDCISKMILSSPMTFRLSLKDNIIPSVALLESLLGSNDVAARVISQVPRLLSYNFETTVLPTFEFFKGLGALEQIRSAMLGYPLGFSHKIEGLKKSAETAKEMGVDASSKRFIYAVLVIVCSSSEGWKLKLQAMRSLGFSDSDLLSMFRKAPVVFMISVEKMKTIIKLLLDTNKYTMSSVVDCPWSLQPSIEKRYMPRLQTLGILESRNLIQDWPSLSKLSTSTDAKFFKEFGIRCLLH